jgi:hypothetical protein
MMKFSKLKSSIIFSTLFIGSLRSFSQEAKLIISKEAEVQRTDGYEKELTDYLKGYLVDEYEERAAKAWDRDYSSIEAFKRSVKPNREKWESMVIKPPVFRKTGPLKRTPYLLGDIKGEWIELPLGPIKAKAILAFPPGASKEHPVPIVIAQHGIGSDPESTFQEGGDISKEYHAYARALLDAGFAVLAPLNLRDVDRRNHIESLCRLANTSLPGIELVRLQNLLDVVLDDPRVDKERVGMWGVSLGGMATMFFMPLEPRIKAGVVSGWFNERRNKMVVPDKRYSSFWPNESHAFFSGWLTEFSDDDIISLICPRPLQVQHGRKDNIAYWPQVEEEFNKAKVHYEKLHITGRIEMILHEGGHEAIVESGIQFMKRWLSAATR